jgi:ERCC4-type nuclease/endogenous inhibitor of DNA gyrase (YacG/DUF329 family)/coenzyme F420-reducing hydrogenase delta subunit
MDRPRRGEDTRPPPEPAGARPLARVPTSKLRDVEGVDATVADKVAERYPTLEKLAVADPDELAALLGVGRNRADRMIQFVQSLRDAVPSTPHSHPVREVLAVATGVGLATAHKVAERYPTFEQVAAADPADLTELHGVGMRKASRVVEVAQQHLTPPAEAVTSDAVQATALAGELTTLPGMRPELAELIARRYGTIDALAEVNAAELTATCGIEAITAEKVLRHARQGVEAGLADLSTSVADPPPEPLDALPHDPQPGTDADPQSAEEEPADNDRSWTDALALVACVLCDRPLLDVPGRTERLLCERCDTGRVTRATQHGVGTAIRRGCRCGECLEAVATTRRWVADRVAGATLQEIAEEAGISRERVRQLLKMLEPSAPWDAVARVERAERAEVEAVAAAAEKQAHLETSEPCPTCGGTVPQPGRRFCSSDCRERWDVLRWHIEEKRRASHRWYAARWTVDNPDAVEDFQLRHALRVLEGTAGSNEERRWLIEGSQPFKVAVEAVVNRWPLADLLPDPVRAQVDEYLGLSVGHWTNVLTAEVMRTEYVARQQTPSAIAKKFRCPVDDVYAALERHSIPRRRGGGSGRARESWGDVLTAEFLQREYVERGRSGTDIAEEIGCNPTVVYAWLERHGIERRQGGDLGYTEE